MRKFFSDLSPPALHRRASSASSTPPIPIPNAAPVPEPVSEPAVPPPPPPQQQQHHHQQSKTPAAAAATPTTPLAQSLPVPRFLQLPSEESDDGSGSDGGSSCKGKEEDGDEVEAPPPPPSEEELEQLLTVNVGGQTFLLTRRLLLGQERSRLFHLLCDPRGGGSAVAGHDRAGALFLDRDSYAFGVVLRWLRTGFVVVQDPSLLGIVRAEFEFFAVQPRSPFDDPAAEIIVASKHQLQHRPRLPLLPHSHASVAAPVPSQRHPSARQPPPRVPAQQQQPPPPPPVGVLYVPVFEPRDAKNRKAERNAGYLRVAIPAVQAIEAPTLAQKQPQHAKLACFVPGVNMVHTAAAARDVKMEVTTLGIRATRRNKPTRFPKRGAHSTHSPSPSASPSAVRREPSPVFGPIDPSSSTDSLPSAGSSMADLSMASMESPRKVVATASLGSLPSITVSSLSLSPRGPAATAAAASAAATAASTERPAAPLSPPSAPPLSSPHPPPQRPMRPIPPPPPSQAATSIVVTPPPPAVELQSAAAAGVSAHKPPQRPHIAMPPPPSSSSMTPL